LFKPPLEGRAGYQVNMCVHQVRGAAGGFSAMPLRHARYCDGPSGRATGFPATNFPLEA
jgi:hypothetical protein